MRDDLIHPEVPGNKWRKLRYNLDAAREAGHDTLLTFGGAYSNHIRATAAAGHASGFATVGVIRGEELADRPLNPSLAFAASRGMRLVFLDRATYRRKHTREVEGPLLAAYGPAYVIPEGGSNEAAVRGCAELVAEIDVDFDVLCVAAGTGGTLAGIAAGLAPGQRAIGFAALKGDFLTAEVSALQHRTYGTDVGDWRVETGFHCGGYARRTPTLDAFTADFATRHTFTPEPVYVAKMLYGLYGLAESGAFPRGTRIIAVVTGPDFGTV